MPHNDKVKVLESAHDVIAHCNIEVDTNIFNTSFASWQDTWLVDTNATSHITFYHDFFEQTNYNVTSTIYFANRSTTFPLGIGMNKLILSRLLDFLLHDVLSILELQRNLSLSKTQNQATKKFH